MRVIPVSYVILTWSDTVLLQRRRGTGWADGLYSLPSGHVEEGETPVDAAVREAREELLITIRPEWLTLAHTTFRLNDDGNRTGFFFRAVKYEGEPRIGEPDRCDDLRWFPADEMPPNILPYVRFVLRTQERYTEWRDGLGGPGQDGGPSWPGDIA